INAQVQAIIEEAVYVEDSFIDYILPIPMEDLNAAGLKQYTRLIADNLLVQLSYSRIYGVTNPYPFANDISLEQKANFYEVRVGAYKRKSLKEILDWRQRVGWTTSENTVDVYSDPSELDF